MKSEDLKVGNKVGYSIFENQKPVGVGKVKSIHLEPNDFGCDVAFVTGKSGCVAISHLTKQ